MPAINYRRNRLKFVYPWEGHRQSARESINQSDLIIVESTDFAIDENPEYQITSSQEIVNFSDEFKNIVTGSEASSFFIDASGTTPTLGNIYVSSPTTSSITVLASTEATGAFAGVSIVLL